MHYLKDFKGFKEASIDLLKPFTLLIGPNGTGKSNLIEAIELLSFIARGQPLYEIADVGRTETGIQVRGGLQACGRKGSIMFALGFEANLRRRSRERVRYSIDIGISPQPQILHEILKVGDRVIFQTLAEFKGSTSGDLTVRYDNFAQAGRKPQTVASSQRSVLSQYREFASKNRNFKDSVQLVQGVMTHLQSSFVFDPNPKLMRGYERIGNHTLSKDGANLSAVLYDLSIGDESQQISLGRLLSRIRQLPDEPYEAFDFTTTDLGDVIFGLRDKTGYTTDARSLSDGTLRTLAILTAMETVQKKSRVIVEEFDNGLHPSRTSLLTSAITEATEQRNLRVLVTTHNPATMNDLTAEQLEGVVLCTWSKAKEAADLIRLVELPRYEELAERGTLGDLVSRRILEQHLAPGFEEQHRKKVAEWIEGLP